MKNLLSLVIIILLSGCSQLKNNQPQHSTISGINNSSNIQYSSTINQETNNDSVAVTSSGTNLKLLEDKNNSLMITGITNSREGFFIAFPKGSTEILMKDDHYYGKDKNLKSWSITYNISDRNCTTIINGSEDTGVRDSIEISGKVAYASDIENPYGIPGDNNEDGYMTIICFTSKNNNYIYINIMSPVSNHSSTVQDIIKNSIID